MSQDFFTFPISILSKGITKYSLYEIFAFNIFDLHLKGMCDRDIEWRLNISQTELQNGLTYGKNVYNIHKDCKVNTAINRDSWLKWYKKVDDESEESKTLLLAFLAAKSIVGKKRYCITNYDMLLSRMAGFEKPQYYTPHPKDKIGKKPLKLPEHLKPYNTRRKRDALRDGLSRFNVSWWSDRGTRGFYLSSTKIQRKKLYKLIKESTHESIDEKRRKDKERIREGASHEGEEGATCVVDESSRTLIHERIVNSLLEKTTALNQFCLQNGINVDEFTAIAHEVVNDWDLQGTTHNDGNDAQRHLLNTIRIKLKERKRNGNNRSTYEEQRDKLYAGSAAIIARLAAEDDARAKRNNQPYYKSRAEQQRERLQSECEAIVARLAAEDDARAAKGVDNSDISNLI